ncbi:MAG: DUF3131 domain-containing protein [Holophagales bacterium]|nr:DUF3131 domain-containing protein [Holophagales bacterium]
MKLTQGLLNARSHLVFLAGLLFASFSILQLEGWDVQSTSDEVFSTLPSPSAQAPRPLSMEELAWARTAWRYFERNVRPETGLADSVEQFPATTLWDTGSFLLGVISAYELGVIEESRFHAVIDQALTSLAKIPLFDDRLPNKSYNTVSLRMVDYDNNETSTGIGWSAIDIGRLLVPLNILVWRYPTHGDKAAEVIARWDFASVVRDGTLYGADIQDGARRLVQEGRLGYEEYSARTFGLLGLDVSEARRYDDYLTWVKVGSERVGADTRTAELYGAHNYVLSEPYMLDGLEFGWDRSSRALAFRVYRAQEDRFRTTGIPTAVTEGHLDRAPYFVYATVFSDGQAWSVLSTDGQDLPELRTLSTKAAFSWHALYRTPYTRSLMAEVSNWYHEERGWMSGRYEDSGALNQSFTCNTNGVILESLNFRQNGPLMHPR